MKLLTVLISVLFAANAFALGDIAHVPTISGQASDNIAAIEADMKALATEVAQGFAEAKDLNGLIGNKVFSNTFYASYKFRNTDKSCKFQVFVSSHAANDNKDMTANIVHTSKGCN